MLYDIFAEKGVNHESKWDKLFPELSLDNRFLLVKNVKDSKRIFKSYVENQKNASRK